MINVYECTDCEHCVSYANGFRIACGNKELPSDAVYRYAPLKDIASYNLSKIDARNCYGFSEGEPQHRTWDKLNEAEQAYLIEYNRLDDAGEEVPETLYTDYLRDYPNVNK